MTYTFTLIAPNGRELDISNDVNYRALEIDAWGIAPVVHYMTQGPNQHGMTHQTYRLQPRTISLVLDIIAQKLQGQMYKRDRIINFVSEYSSNMSLRVAWDVTKFVRSGLLISKSTETIERQIDCYYNGGLNFPSTGVKGFSMIDVIDLVCPDPIWYDPHRKSRALSGQKVVAGANKTVVPTVLPTLIGTDDFDHDMKIYYEGTWDEYPVIEITGPVADLVITNRATGDILDFTGHTIDALKTYTIDLRYGYKTVTEDAGTNEIEHLTAASDLATFRLVRRKAEKANRLNTIHVEGGSVTSATLVKIKYYDRYQGI